MKCPFCGGTYRLLKAPGNEEKAFFVPSCYLDGKAEGPAAGIICDLFICPGCGNLQLVAKRKPAADKKK